MSISPVSPVVKFAAELAAPLNDPDLPFEHICYTVPWNMSENPAISINGGYDAKGFPIGVQIIGRRFDDIGVLGMAKAFEGLRGRASVRGRSRRSSSFVIPGHREARARNPIGVTQRATRNDGTKPQRKPDGL